MKFNRLFPFLLILLVSIALVSCNSKSSDSLSSAATSGKHALLQELPADSIGFFLMDLDSPAYKEVQTSVWANGGMDIVQKFGDDPSAAPLKGFLDLATHLQSQMNTHVSSVAGFVPSSSMDKDLEAGFVIRARSSAARAAFLAAAEAQLAQQGMAVGAVSDISGAKSFSFGEANKNFYYATVGDTDIIATTGADLLKSSLNLKAENKGVTKLTESAGYKAGRSEFGNRKGEYLYGYWDLSQLKDNFKQAVADVADAPKDIPFTGLSVSQGMDQGPYFNLALELDGTNQDATKIKQALSGIGNLAGTDALPVSSVLAMGLNGKAINNLMESFAEQIPADANAEIDMQRLKDLGSMLVSVQGAAPGSMFPGVNLVLNSSQAGVLKADLKKTVGDALAAQMGGQIPWQSKKVNDLDTEYLLTPLGIGIYITELNGSLIVSSSEPGISDLVSAASGKSGSLKSALPATVTDQASVDGTIFHFVLRFNELVALAQQLSGSLAMFTGGEEVFDQKELDKLQKLGVLSMAARSNGNIIAFSSQYGSVASS